MHAFTEIVEASGSRQGLHRPMTDQNTTTQDTPGNVVALRTPQFSEAQALAWLRERGRMTAPASHLARVWGWPERRTMRKLDSWQRAGLVRRKGKLITVVAAKSDTPISVKRTANGQAQTEQADTGCATSDTNADLKSDTPTSVKRTGRSKAPPEAGLPELPPERTPLVPLPPLAVTDRLDLGHNESRVDYLGGSGRVLALGLAIVGLIANATFGVSMGITVTQQTLYALLWASIDGIALWLPSMALWLWRNQHRTLSATAWVMCAAAIYASALAANGFLSSTVGNTIAERQSLIEQRAGLARHKEDLERDLAAVQLPPTITSDAGMTTLEAATKSKAEARERECLRPGPICHQYENEETEMRKKLADVHASRAAYDRADKLKAGITADQHAIDALPAITNADPQAASTAAFLQWASFGRLGPSTNAVAASRIGVVVIFLTLPGFLLMLCGLRRAASLQSRKQHHRRESLCRDRGTVWH
jgi:hypothetical protein